MNTYKVDEMIKVVRGSVSPGVDVLERLLGLAEPEDIERLKKNADEIRHENLGPGILVRGIIEFSNECRNTCLYCGLNRMNKDIERYSLVDEDIYRTVREIRMRGISTVILQSGENLSMDAGWLKEVIEEIKLKYDIAVTLSVGERPFSDYRLWRKAGADRYLLKIETVNKALYLKLHPGMDLDNRKRCLYGLKELGYQTGSGNIIGLPGQSLSDIAADMIFLKKLKLDMIGVGPFVPHHATPLGGDLPGDPGLTVKALALLRILNEKTHIPSTTALANISHPHGIEAFASGANVLMLNFTPEKVKHLYSIYPRSAEVILSDVESVAAGMGRYIDWSRGDSTVGRGEKEFHVQHTRK